MIKKFDEFSVAKNEDAKIESVGEVNESVMDIINSITEFFTDDTKILVGSELYEKGKFLQAIIGGLLGIGGSAIGVAYKDEIVDAIKKKYKNMADAIKKIVKAKEGEKIA